MEPRGKSEAAPRHGWVENYGKMSAARWAERRSRPSGAEGASIRTGNFRPGAADACCGLFKTILDAYHSNCHRLAGYLDDES
jgi:hypothetical protein